MIMSDNTKQAEGLGDFFKNLGKKGIDVSKNMAKTALKNPGRALDIGANVVTAFVSQSPKSALSSIPEVISFYHTGKGLHLGKLVKFMLYKWIKKQLDFTRPHHCKILL